MCKAMAVGSGRIRIQGASLPVWHLQAWTSFPCSREGADGASARARPARKAPVT